MDNDLYNGLKGFLATAKIPDKTPPEFYSLIKKIAPKYALENDTIYKLEESRQGTLGPPRGRQHRNLLTVPPHCQLPMILKNYHDHHLARHQAKENTYQKIAEQYYWP